MDLRTAWQEQADAWVRWARSPDLDDDFWRFHLPHFLSLLPPPGRLTVDVGCGEGRLGRILAAAGHRIVGCEAELSSQYGVARVSVRRAIADLRAKGLVVTVHGRGSYTAERP